ncbi:MAG: YceI family protein [Candidatus Limnocylindria bacterium]
MKWRFDPPHSSVTLSAKHMMITTVRGRVAAPTGEVDFDPEAGPASAGVRLEIDAKTIDTGDAKRDGHLRSADFLAVADHPAITFTSTSIERKSESSYVVTGDLTIRGTTRPVRVDVAATPVIDDGSGGKRIGIDASATIDRREWGLEWNLPVPGGLLVSNEVKIEAAIELVAQPAA